MTKEEYNNEPVHYCSNCYSLAIKILDDINIDVCLDCGNTDIKKAESFEEYNKLYVNQFDVHFLEETGEEEL